MTDLTPLRIAMLSIHSSPIGKLGTRDTGGMSVYIRELAREIGRRGHRVDIYTRSPSRNAPAVMQIYPNVRLVHLRGGAGRGLERDALYPYLGDFFRALESTPQVQNRQYNLIHSHYWLSGWLGSWAAKRWSCPHVVTFHTLGIAKDTAAAGPPESRMRTATEREVSRLCDRVLSSTGRDRQQLIEGYHADPDKVRVVPCGVNLSLFRPASRRAARKRLGLAPDEPVALYVGRFDPVKGMDRLLEAIAQTDRSSRLQLVIVGGDGRTNAEHRRLQAKSRQLGIDERVRFVGRIDQLELPPYYHAADMLVLPSHYESFGLVTLEALGCGIPVVATPVGVAAEILQPRRNGLIVGNADSGGLARGIETVFDWQRRGLLSPETIRSSVEAYRWNRIASTVLAEYRQVLERPADTLRPVPSERASCL